MHKQDIHIEDFQIIKSGGFMYGIYMNEKEPDV